MRVGSPRGAEPGNSWRFVHRIAFGVAPPQLPFGDAVLLASRSGVVINLMLRGPRLLEVLGRRAAAAASAAAAWSLATDSADRQQARCDAAPSARPRVLITGFTDWKKNATGSNLWRCNDNPSCRLLLGAATEAPPILREGPLVQALKNANVQADFTFEVLPVTWGTANGLDLSSFDVVIHIGLGVYDSHSKLLLENGAYNLRSESRDALNRPGTGEVIESGAQKHLKLGSGMLKRYADLRRQPSTLTTAAGNAPAFVVVEAPSRKENSYICNETHWRSLRAVEESGGSDEARLAAAYFIHVPYAHPQREAGYDELAAAVAALVARVVSLEGK